MFLGSSRPSVISSLDRGKSSVVYSTGKPPSPEHSSLKDHPKYVDEVFSLTSRPNSVTPPEGPRQSPYSSSGGSGVLPTQFRTVSGVSGRGNGPGISNRCSTSLLFVPL